MGAMKASDLQTGEPVYAKAIGYLQYIDIPALQIIAEEFDLKINIISLPGKFLTPDQPIAYIEDLNKNETNLPVSDILNTFTIDDDRVFDEDPRFGLIILSEIGSRALSSAVNDPGTAIDIIESFIRLFSIWVDEEINEKQDNLVADRVLSHKFQ